MTAQIIYTAILLSVGIIFLHYLDNKKNHRQEVAKYYYKRTFVACIVFIGILFVVNAHVLPKNNSSSSFYGGQGIHTGPPPF